MKKYAAVLALFATTALFAASAAADAFFDFYIPWDDGARTAIDLSGLSEFPAGARGRVRAGSDGHLYTDGGRVRFWGVSLSGAANFPDRDASVKIARHLAKFGVNLVRFFDMDYRQSPNGIWVTTHPDRTLSAGQLDKMDFFFAELKKNGIYADINLVTDRPFNPNADVSRQIDELADWKTRAALGFFDRPVRELEKKYARDLLTHRNPYTGMSYAEDPAVAFVEIKNENGMAHAFLRGALDNLPPHFSGELRGLWNGWLEKKYADNAALSSAWGAAKVPEGAEMLANADFSSNLIPPWVIENNGGAKTRQSVSREGPAGARALRVDVLTPGSQDWYVQLNQPGLDVKAGVPYNLVFYAKADRTSTIDVEIAQAHDPWRNLGFRASVKLTPEWSRYEFTSFVLLAGDANARLNFSNLGIRMQSIWLSGVSLRPGGNVGLARGEALRSPGIALFDSTDMGFRTPAARRDWYAFLLDVESRYWEDMRSFLRNDLKVGALLYGTIIGTSTPTLMAQFDAVDAHTYWKHPVFPVKQWDMSNWYQENSAMADDPYYSAVSDLAVRSVEGKPQLVTEYSHPYPNTFGAEGFFFFSAYAGLQDWDVLVPFAYCARLADWDVRKIPNFFDVDQNPNQLAAFIPAAAAFRRFDFKPAEKTVTVPIDRGRETELLLDTLLWKLVDAENAGIPRLAGYLHKVAMRIVPDGEAEADPRPVGLSQADVEEAAASRTVFSSDTGELRWDVSTKERGVFTADGARTKMVVGFSGGRRFVLDDVVIEPKDTVQQGFSVIAATVMQGDSFRTARRVILTALGTEMNAGTVWLEYPDRKIGFPPADGERVTLGTGFGIAPSRVEGITAVVRLPAPADGTKAWALDSTGNRTAEVTVSGDSGSSSIAIGPSYRALWYEVEISR